MKEWGQELCPGGVLLGGPPATAQERFHDWTYAA